MHGAQDLAAEQSSKLEARKEIRAKFVALRNRLGWSQTEAARELGTDQGTVNQWESLARPIPERYRVEIALRAGETLAYFLPDAVGDDERAEKLIAAKWMERMAKQLRDEAEATSTAADEKSDADRAGAARARGRATRQGPKGKEATG